MATNVVAYLGVCSLVGVNLLVPNVGATSHHGVDVESVIGWVNSSGRIEEEIYESNETIPNFPKYNLTRGHNGSVTANLGNCPQENNASAGVENRRLKGNNTGIPIELFFGWWSVVRPFGNEVVSKPKFPWMVAVQSKRGPSNSHLCSGKILTKLYVLSTCRCLSTPTGSAIVPLAPKDPSTISIIAGVSMLNIPLKEQLLYGQIRNAVAINIHPHCTITQKYDYAVIELEYYLYYTSRVLPIPDPFVLVHGQTSEVYIGKAGRFTSMKENDICQAAGWPTKQTFWGGETDDSKGEQKLSNFRIMGKDRCLAATPTGHQLVCAKVVNPWMPIYGRSVDVGSGLVCNNQVTAILSHHSGDYAVFSSLRGALSFIWEYYQDQNEIYVISLSQLPAVSSMLLFFTIHVPVIATCL